MREQVYSIVLALAFMGLNVSSVHALNAGPVDGEEGSSSQPATQNKSIQAPKTAVPVAAKKPPAKINFGSLQESSQVTAPGSGGNQNAIIAVLQKQRQAADAEAAQMKLGIHPQARPAATITGRSPSTVPNVQKTGTGTLGPEKTMGSGSIVSNTVTNFNSAPLVCGNDPTMRILTVSGESAPATFTSDDNYNFYTIVGCSFGDPGPNAKVYIYYQNTFHQDFDIQEWHDNGIKLNLHHNLRGLVDQSNVTLVVQRADGKQASKTGYKFYAARETHFLSRFPKDQFSLWGLTLNDTSHLVPQYESPAPVAKYAAEVSWQCTNCSAKEHGFNNVYMQSNEDVWSLKNLQRGFVVANYGMAHRDLQCAQAGYQLHTEGSWSLKLEGSDLHAQWQGQTCIDQGCGGAFQPDCFAMSGADYLIDINVSGPRGVDPWTGQPTP